MILFCFSGEHIVVNVILIFPFYFSVFETVRCLCVSCLNCYVSWSIIGKMSFLCSSIHFMWISCRQLETCICDLLCGPSSCKSVRKIFSLSCSSWGSVFVFQICSVFVGSNIRFDLANIPGWYVSTSGNRDS